MTSLTRCVDTVCIQTGIRGLDMDFEGSKVGKKQIIIPQLQFGRSAEAGGTHTQPSEVSGKMRRTLSRPSLSRDHFGERQNEEYVVVSRVSCRRR
jgi:hypothetical protein